MERGQQNVQHPDRGVVIDNDFGRFDCYAGYQFAGSLADQIQRVDHHHALWIGEVITKLHPLIEIRGHVR